MSGESNDMSFLAGKVDGGRTEGCTLGSLKHAGDDIAWPLQSVSQAIKRPWPNPGTAYPM